MFDIQVGPVNVKKEDLSKPDENDLENVVHHFKSGTEFAGQGNRAQLVQCVGTNQHQTGVDQKRVAANGLNVESDVECLVPRPESHPDCNVWMALILRYVLPAIKAGGE